MICEAAEHRIGSSRLMYRCTLLHQPIADRDRVFSLMPDIVILCSLTMTYIYIFLVLIMYESFHKHHDSIKCPMKHTTHLSPEIIILVLRID